MRSAATSQPATRPPPAPDVAMTGKLYRGALDGEVRGWLFDHRSGFRVEFTGCRDPRGGYLLMGKVVAT
jgi:hypothetical protein